MYAVIGRRHGKILSGDLTQGSGNFAVTCLLPVIESFNFAQEMRKQTSGLACPQLMFSHWEVSCSCCQPMLLLVILAQVRHAVAFNVACPPLYLPLSLSLCLAICHVRALLCSVVVCAWSAAKNLSLPWLLLLLKSYKLNHSSNSSSRDSNSSDGSNSCSA